MRTRLRAARIAKGMTQAELAKKLDTTQQTLQRWESGTTELRAEALQKLSRVLGVSISYLLGLTDTQNGSSKTSAYTDIPLYGSIAAGTPIEMLPVDDTYPIPTELHDRYPHAFLLKVVGQSMNRILPNGSYALIEPCDTASEEMQPYAVRVDHNDATIKRVHRLAHGVQLIPDSTDPTYHPAIYDDTDPDSDDVAIIGRVVWYCVPYNWQF